MKHLTLETSKRLQEAWILEWVETDYRYWEHYSWWWSLIEWCDWDCDTYWIVWDIPAPNLEEAIELLPKKIWDKVLTINPASRWDRVYYEKNYEIQHEIIWKTLIKTIEKMLIYLLDNNLIWKKK